MTKSQNLFKRRKWVTISNNKSNWLLKGKGKTDSDEEQKVLTAIKTTITAQMILF